MSAATVDIDRIELALFGVSPAEAESAAATIEQLLRQRLAGWRPDIAGVSPTALGNLDLGRVDITRLDAPALATLIADRLIAQLEGAFAMPRATGESA